MATTTPSPATEAPVRPAPSASAPQERSATRQLRDRLRRADPDRIEPMEDYGWFGPDSVTWKVWSYPTAPTVGFSRAVVVEELDPFLIAPVKNSSKIYSQTSVRYDRTLRYFATYLFADSRKIAHATQVLMKVHHKAASPDPVSGLLSDPNNPDEQLWIHMTAWHSILYTYEQFGPGRLTAEEETRYWAECAIAAQAQTIDPDRVPRSRDEVREYFRLMRPRLAASEATQEAMSHLMDPDGLYPPVPAVARPALWAYAKLFRAAVIATLPQYQRDLANLRQPKVVDALVTPIMRLGMRIVARSPRVQLAIVAALSPSTVPVVGPVLLGLPPRSTEILTPQETFRRHDVPTPRELYAELGHDQGTIVYPPSAPVPSEVAERYAVS
ncbi:DUF2236 domain-containing protein [Conexibacter sp. W3-3-2]|uniref:oxygenase MpaB family protein n=1 Tax=Conexibacter sp. W3-3-2 TaxID=2675227 RepID=UPI0012BA1F2F|nr:oxygenase MpaB family protein [Conexibacter sp. W3-3-2]MTD45210.1 DUF2236 domain-containing protein [Conexibacter sp. W3-3-2]